MLEKRQMQQIMLIDDHKLLLYGLKLVLNPYTHSFIEATDFYSAQALIKENRPQLAIIDYRLGKRTGVELVAELHSYSPDTRILAYSHVTDEDAIVRMISAGAQGFVSKSDTEEELIKAIAMLLEGHLYYNGLAQGHLLNRLSSPADRKKGILVNKLFFSAREIELIKLLAQEHTARQIGERMVLSQRSVEQYKSGIARKMEVHNMLGIVIYALKHGLIRREEL